METLPESWLREHLRAGLERAGIDTDRVWVEISACVRRKLINLRLGGLTGDDEPLPVRAGWYLEHEDIPQALSEQLHGKVLVYAVDPEGFEEVSGWADGRRVGGDRLVYREAELPEECELDDEAFEKLRSRWPFGRLAFLYGLDRRRLAKICRAPGLKLPISVEEPGDGPDDAEPRELLGLLRDGKLQGAVDA